MRIMVFDVPAESGGAITILEQYYDNAVKDKDNKWYFVISKPSLTETENVKILKYPWVKKSWFHRLFFDYFLSKKIIKKHDIDEIISLQNVTINIKSNIKQTLYLHQPLPFVEKKFRLTENYIFWMYQNIISRRIFNSLKRADTVIVQTNWMKKACIERVKINPEKIKVIPPIIDIANITEKYENANLEEKETIFFYPAGAQPYKNHDVIVKASELLIQEGINDFKIVFTLNGVENKDIKRLFKEIEVNDLPVYFIGGIKLDEVYEYYTKSVLVFPSYIETFGLPLLEARMHGSPIIASNCAFSHEILDGYNNVQFFNPDSSEELKKVMRTIIFESRLRNDRTDIHLGI